MANNFKPWVDSPTAGQQVQSASVFATDAQRVDGFKAGDPASALRVNSALRQANIVVAGLMQMCDDIKTLPDGLSLMSTVTQVKNAIKAAIDQLDATVLASAKSYTDTREGVINVKLTDKQNQITSNKNRLDTLESRVDNLEDEVAALNGSSSTLGQRVTTLEDEMDTAQADITQLKGYYEVNLTTSSWTGSAGNYSYSIPAATHKRGTRPRVHTYVDGEETYDSPKIDWTTGNVTVYSNAQVALKVLIY
jgi:hypothetical protein|uniref:Uncharacterized protein n=1 Tax=Phage sp. ctqZP6 TaxID=2828010 RepID=A0A8S5SI30_9VIRU|nr:MAG TPA: hypothetical protein [Phage sp. ctqZP6]